MVNWAHFHPIETRHDFVLGGRGEAIEHEVASVCEGVVIVLEITRLGYYSHK